MSSPLDRALSAIDRQLLDGWSSREREVLEAHAHDESDAAPALPGAVVTATSTLEVSAVLRAATEHGVPVTPRAGGTGRVGGAVPSPGGIVLSMVKMDALHTLDEAEMLAVVGPGMVTGTLHDATESVGLFYPPDPNSSASCTLGGNIAANAAGPRALKYGVTRDYVLGLEVVTASGEVLRVGRRTRKGVTGYDLTALVVGSEGTLGVVTEATLKLALAPEATATLLVLFDAEAEVVAGVRAALRASVPPRCCELLDGMTLDILRADGAAAVPASTRAMLIVELDGVEASLEAAVEEMGNALLAAGAADVLVARHGGDRARLWAARKQMSRSIRRLAAHKMSEDVVVPRTRLGELLERIRVIGEDEALRMPAYGHAGDGNLHVNFLWDDPEERLRVERAIGRLFAEVVALGGTLSGEHGLGLTKAPYLGLEQSAELIALQRRIKASFDPKGVLNPGKVLPAIPRHGAC